MSKNLPVSLDQRQFRDEQRKKCERELTRLQKLRESLSHYEANDQPAFSSWLHRFFGTELTRLRELYELQERKYEFIKEVEREAILNQISFHKAFKKILKRKSRETVESEISDDDLNEDDLVNLSDDDALKKTSKKKSKKDQSHSQNESHSRHHHDDDDHRHRHHGHTHAPAKPRPGPATADIKGLYRELVRQLHPDLNPNLDQRKKELWHQVQEAYENRDHGRLDQLASFSNLIDRKTAESETLEALKKMFKELRRSCREIEKALIRVRQEPDWDFTNVVKERARLERLQVKVSIEIEMDLERILASLEELDNLVNSWQMPEQPRTSRGGRRRSRRSHSHDDGFDD